MQASGPVSSRVFRYDNLKFFLILLVVTGHFIDPFDEQSKVFQSLFLFILICTPNTGHPVLGVFL